MNFVSASFCVAVFFVILSIAFFFLGNNLPNKKGIFTPKNLSYFGAIIYFVLTHLAIVTALGQSVALTYQSPCENVVTNSTYYGNTTLYEYVDSCAGDEAPRSAENLYVILLYILYSFALVSLVGMVYSIYYLFRWGR